MDRTVKKMNRAEGLTNLLVYYQQHCLRYSCFCLIFEKKTYLILRISTRDHSFSPCAKFSENLALIRTCTCVYQRVKNVVFLEYFAYVLNE